tara:strand:- start:58773 stop:59852 length:1080 start_codon:yes stop_codon:yes gene_type:complete
MAKIDKTYEKLLKEILKKGYRYEDPNRKGIYRIELGDYKIIHNFEDGFPAITTKTLFWRGVVEELLWFLRGETNIKSLVDVGVHIWDKDAYNHYLKTKKVYKNGKQISFGEFQQRLKSTQVKDMKKRPEMGDLGRVYGAQWRDWKDLGVHLGYDSKGYPETTVKNEGVDQISNLIKGLKENPMGTQHIVTAWNPSEIKYMALPPCHWSFEIIVEPIPQIKSQECPSKGKTDVPTHCFTLKWHQRSVDTFLGLPFNIASYGLLAQMIGMMTGLRPKGIIGDLSNVHLYEPHLEAVNTQLQRGTDFMFSRCDLEIQPQTKIKLKNNMKTVSGKLNSLEAGDFNLDRYRGQGHIPATMLARD